MEIIQVEQLIDYANKYYDAVEEVYGHSKHHTTTPHVYLCEDQLEGGTKGEYCYLINEITIYYNNIHSHEELIRVLIHEYQHYLQSPSWFTRYYRMGYRYDNHPYEVAAYKEEENWKQIWKKAS